MRIRSTWVNVIWMAALCFCLAGQTPPAQDTAAKEAAAKEAAAKEAAKKDEPPRLPPRTAPTDYQAHAKAGTVTIAADFQVHAVPTPLATFNSEDYVVVEVGLFGPPGARLTISTGDFSLRINEKKSLESRPYGMVLSSLKDPSWEPPDTGESKSKTGINTGGGGQDATPVVVHMPFPLQRAMELKVQKAAMPEGDRALPEAGLIFFSYHGREKGIHSVELTYAGPAGKVILRLTP
ncbi:MAG TPA: hypothetical protein VME43_33295 [Bryobacteraceae bacterium]|nr:hypothetical protein [Bryobacteraceae bacterium]